MKTTTGNIVYYKFECDDENRPAGMKADVCFSLLELDKALALKNELDSKLIQYTFLLETFNEEKAEIVGRDYFVDNNSFNQ